jgi:glycine betaine catabolism B
MIDKLLNKITMYRLLMYGLGALILVSAIFSFAGVLSYSGAGIISTVVVLFVSCYCTNKLLGKLFGATTNSESYIITALILACILPPTVKPVQLLYVGLAGVISVASKFVLAYRRKHIFNPAALAAVAVSLSGLMSVTWWIGTPSMLPFVIVLGALVLRKLHHTNMVAVFLGASILMLGLVAQVSGIETSLLVKNAVLSGPLIFFAVIMLTEPATMPASKYHQILYAVLVGALYSSQLRFGVFSTSPHMVLLAGNIFAYIVNPKIKLNMILKERIQISAQVYDFVFTPDKAFKFVPGQYMEWTLKHKKVDSRGNRRSFTIASSPTEKDVHIGVKFYDPSSSFKSALLSMNMGDRIAAGNISGSFSMPEDALKKLVFIAGGVGITPFRSMVKYLVDTNQKRDIKILYFVSSADEVAYKDVSKQGTTIGVVLLPVVNKPLSLSMLRLNIPDYEERIYYISGPNGFVKSYHELLRSSGVPSTHIKTDYFSGY